MSYTANQTAPIVEPANHARRDMFRMAGAGLNENHVKRAWLPHLADSLLTRCLNESGLCLAWRAAYWCKPGELQMKWEDDKGDVITGSKALQVAV